MESRQFKEFMGARVSEVKVNSNIDKEWCWLTGYCRPRHKNNCIARRPSTDSLNIRKAWYG
jgi:hypothetical protein